MLRRFDCFYLVRRPRLFDQRLNSVVVDDNLTLAVVEPMPVGFGLEPLATFAQGAFSFR
mgnify:CR=1 FL=1